MGRVVKGPSPIPGITSAREAGGNSSFDPEFQVDTVVFDDELTPGQARNWNGSFPSHCRPHPGDPRHLGAGPRREGACRWNWPSSVLAPALVGKGSSSHASAEESARGPGETKLETDRRRIRRRIADLKAEVDKVRKHRALHRRRRKKQQQPVVALVGYTNM